MKEIYKVQLFSLNDGPLYHREVQSYQLTPQVRPGIKTVGSSVNSWVTVYLLLLPPYIYYSGTFLNITKMVNDVCNSNLPSLFLLVVLNAHPPHDGIKVMVILLGPLSAGQAISSIHSRVCHVIPAYCPASNNKAYTEYMETRLRL